jgi:SNF2 family DNA or RNA helicase
MEGDSDLLIISVDTLAGERMFACLQEPSVIPYDLVVFDEAHKLSADREPDFSLRKTDRYRLAETLAGIRNGEPRWHLDWQCHHLLLLTATPHMGKDIPYYCPWRLLEPEVLSTFDAFSTYPIDARRRHFLRRTKEEMVRFDGSPIYPTRLSDTLSYDLTQGEVSEQRLYDETTSYIRTFYNRARILNRSAARLAMSVFQRRLASSTYALLRSFERRLEKLQQLIEDIQSGRLSLEQLVVRQRQLDNIRDVFEEETADEERTVDGVEENETAEDQALNGVVAVSLAELEAERRQVQRLLDLAQRVYDASEESKFEKLREILRDPRYRHEKIIIFTEHRDTLEFLLRRLEGLGFTGQVAQIHGGMDYQDREAQVEFFRQPGQEGGATYLVATDAAGEGINLQFCWLMVNYDIPWNPARLEQRMGRIHRYGQRHDPVIILNLVAGKTREGRVLKTLLEKLERIRRELGSDKVFDVIGRLFGNYSRILRGNER